MAGRSKVIKWCLLGKHTTRLHWRSYIAFAIICQLNTDWVLIFHTLRCKLTLANVSNFYFSSSALHGSYYSWCLLCCVSYRNGSVSHTLYYTSHHKQWDGLLELLNVYIAQTKICITYILLTILVIIFKPRLEHHQSVERETNQNEPPKLKQYDAEQPNLKVLNGFPKVAPIK